MNDTVLKGGPIGGTASDQDGPTAQYREGLRKFDQELSMHEQQSQYPQGCLINMTKHRGRPNQQPPMQHQKLRDSQQRKYG